MTRPLTVEVLLLALGDANGKPLVDSTSLKAVVAGAAIVELTFDGALRLTGKDDPEFKEGRLVRTAQAVSEPRLAEVAELSHERKPRHAVARIGGVSAWSYGTGGLQHAVLDDLVREGVLRHVQGRTLGLFPTNAWPLARPEVQREILDRVRAAVVTGAEPDARTSALVALLHAVDLLPTLFPDQRKRDLRARGKAIAEADWGADAVRKAVKDVQAAVTAAIVATTVAVASGSA